MYEHYKIKLKETIEFRKESIYELLTEEREKILTSHKNKLYDLADLTYLNNYFKKEKIILNKKYLII